MTMLCVWLRYVYSVFNFIVNSFPVQKYPSINLRCISRVMSHQIEHLCSWMAFVTTIFLQINYLFWSMLYVVFCRPQWLTIFHQRIMDQSSVGRHWRLARVYGGRKPEETSWAIPETRRWYHHSPVLVPRINFNLVITELHMTRIHVNFLDELCTVYKKCLF